HRIRRDTMNTRLELAAMSNARDPLTISLRAFVPPPEAPRGERKSKKSAPSEYTLVFDCETLTELSQRLHDRNTNTMCSQQLRFGVYQVYKGTTLVENRAGIFFDPDSLTKDERALLKQYASGRKLRLVTKKQFVEDVFYGIGYDLRATIVGF